VSQRKAKEARRQERGAAPPQSGRRLPGGSRLWIVCGAAVLAAVVFVGILSARGTDTAAPIAQRGGDVVSFSGRDPVTGREVALSDYEGRPLAINVWGSWCTGCKAEAEALRRFAENHPEVQVIGVDLQDSIAGAKAFYQRYGWTHPSVFDPDGAISFSLGLQGTPTTFFTDREHRIVTRIVGETDYDGFVQAMRAALDGS
jgi:thiol-disulfide isomerase/thioredoxin